MARRLLCAPCLVLCLLVWQALGQERDAAAPIDTAPPCDPSASTCPTAGDAAVHGPSSLLQAHSQRSTRDPGDEPKATDAHVDGAFASVLRAVNAPSIPSESDWDKYWELRAGESGGFVIFKLAEDAQPFLFVIDDMLDWVLGEEGAEKMLAVLPDDEVRYIVPVPPGRLELMKLDVCFQWLPIDMSMDEQIRLHDRASTFVAMVHYPSQVQSGVTVWLSPEGLRASFPRKPSPST